MPRCASTFSPRHRAARRALLAALAAGTLAALAAPAGAQVHRLFPAQALRGRIEFTNPPSVRLNGDDARLAPGIRIHGTNNMLVLYSQLAGDGRRYDVDYKLDGQGLVLEVWMLTPAEADVEPWPRSADDAAKWTFDYMAQTWTKP